MLTTSSNKPAHGFSINILIPKAKYMNQDLRRFSGHIPVIFEELNIFSRVKIVKLQQEEKKLQLK